MLFKKCSLLLFFTLISQFAWGSENACPNILSQHLKEAISHNKKFNKVYSELSNGETSQLSYSLMSEEKLSFLFLGKIEKEASEFQAKGINVLCEEIIPMNLARASKELIPEDRRPVEFTKLAIKDLKSELKELINEDQFEKAYDLMSPILLELEKNPEQACLTRHFLESMARTIKFIPIHREKANALGVEDSVSVSKKFLLLQLHPLVFNYHLDKKAFVYQKAGISIFCNDIPALPWKK